MEFGSEVAWVSYTDSALVVVAAAAAEIAAFAVAAPLSLLQAFAAGLFSSLPRSRQVPYASLWLAQTPLTSTKVGPPFYQKLDLCLTSCWYLASLSLQALSKTCIPTLTPPSLYAGDQFQRFWLRQVEAIVSRFNKEAHILNAIKCLPADELLEGAVSARLVTFPTADNGAARDLKSVDLTKHAACLPGAEWISDRFFCRRLETGVRGRMVFGPGFGTSRTNCHPARSKQVKRKLSDPKQRRCKEIVLMIQTWLCPGRRRRKRGFSCILLSGWVHRQKKFSFGIQNFIFSIDFGRLSAGFSFRYSFRYLSP